MIRTKYDSCLYLINVAHRFAVLDATVADNVPCFDGNGWSGKVADDTLTGIGRLRNKPTELGFRRSRAYPPTSVPSHLKTQSCCSTVAR